MALLDDVLNSALPKGSLAKPLLLALLGLLASGSLFGGGGAATQPGNADRSRLPSGDGGSILDGLGGLLDRFRQAGQGSAADSWVGSGPNQPVTPTQVGNALGPNILKTLSERSGIPEAELVRQLSQVLPGVVDKLTPQGRLPTLAEIDRG